MKKLFEFVEKNIVGLTTIATIVAIVVALYLGLMH